jgi:hypothetical protein
MAYGGRYYGFSAVVGSPVKPRKPIQRSRKPVKRKSAHQSLVDEADSWATAIAIQIYGERCMLAHIPNVHCGGGLQGAHILRKGGMYASIRYHEENRLPICRNHHMYWAHLYEQDFYQWVEATFPGRIERLKETARAPHRKIDLRELICVLKHIHKQGLLPPGREIKYMPIPPDSELPF